MIELLMALFSGGDGDEEGASTRARTIIQAFVLIFLVVIALIFIVTA
jgi:hypothetical protein